MVDSHLSYREMNMLEHVKKEKLIKHEGLCSKVTYKSTHVSKQKKKAETKVLRGWK
jgi:hypothetical protein